MKKYKLVLKDESYCIRALKEAQEKFFKDRGDEDISYGIKVEEDKDKMVISAYAEVGYTTLEKMCDVLNKTLDQYKGRPDANYYFEPDYPGVATCYIWKEKEVKDSKKKIKDTDEYFVVTLENMSKEDAKSYSRCYGLRAKPARTGGYQLAGDEDSVREMLEDYIGRYDKIGKIMNEGYYVSADSFRDSDSYMNKVKYAVVYRNLEDDSLIDAKVYEDPHRAQFEYGIALANRKPGLYVDIEEVTPESSLWEDSKYSKKVKDSPKIYKIDGVEYILSKDGYGNYKLDEKKTGDRVADWDSYSDAIKDINKWIKQNKITDSKKVKDSDYEFEYQDSYNNKDTFYNFKDLKKEVEESEKVAKKENLYFSWAVKVWASNGNAYFDSADGDTLKDVENFIKNASKYKDSKKVKDSYEGNLEALEEFLEWEGIIGYDSDIQEIYETNEAWVNDELKTFDTPYEALDAYLEWEGILGYTDAIYDILENGVESPYYNDMLEEKQSYEED